MSRSGWTKDYSVPWNDTLGTLKTDLPYGEGEANKFDLYLPADNSRESYGLAVYLHAGGFTSGDKVGDREMLSWLCSKVERMKPISAASWVTPDAPPTVVAYGTHDRIQPFKASLRLKAALEENHVDFQYIEFPHSGHGLQNDNACSRQWMESIEEYLDKYMPIE